MTINSNAYSIASPYLNPSIQKRRNKYTPFKRANGVSFIVKMGWMKFKEVSFTESESRLLANTTSVAKFESDVAELAPFSSPGVLEPPGLSVDSDQQDIVVDLSAGAAIVDS